MRTMILSMSAILVGASAPLGATVDIQRWDFDSDADLKYWVPNSYLAGVSVQDGILSASAIEWDPFFICRDVSIAASPWQYVVIRIRANRPGIGELFWSGELTGQYGGLTENKKVRFSVDGDNDWHDIVLFPFWHTEKTIRQLRLDVYEGTHFDIDWIRVCQWGVEASPTDVFAWSFGGDTREWQIHSGTSELLAPPVNIDANNKPWITVQLASDQEDVASILWACEHTVGLQTEEFVIKGDGKPHSYNLQMAGNPAWHGSVVAFGIRLPQDKGVRLDSIRLGAEPSGPGDLEVRYFGFENGVNRSGRPCRILARVQNSGGASQGIRSIHLLLPEGLRLATEPERLSHSGLAHNETAAFTWEIVAEKPGVFPVRLTFSGKGNLPADREVNLQFTEPPSVPKSVYAPVPLPVKTDVEICAFYFPGWNTDAKWDCIRQTAPNRKPLLGYYDESKPACVDWQIKWAVENGISCFLVDWYWVQGRQQLTHWFEAYRKARYRDFLKVAVMWANHNPPNTHSVEDWLNVTREWIDRYFTLPRYYRIGGQPAVFIWNPAGIRSDLGGSDAVKKVLDASQQMARTAGFNGITFVAMNSGFDATHIQMLLHEGYSGITTYHEWGSVIDGSVSQRRFNYEDVVHQGPAAWREKDDASGSLTYYPLVDTGWDSRPWHGNKAMVIEGRTPQGFEQLLREADAFCRERSKPMLILGPVNEWGEGSYIEPCTDFGFDMLEGIRRVFAKGDSQNWPTNISPSDIGLGP